MTPANDSRKRHLKRLEERASLLYDTLELPNGERVEVGPQDRVRCMISLLETPEEREERGEDPHQLHWLAQAIRDSDQGRTFNEESESEFIKLCLVLGRSAS